MSLNPELVGVPFRAEMRGGFFLDLRRDRDQCENSTGMRIRGMLQRPVRSSVWAGILFV